MEGADRAVAALDAAVELKRWRALETLAADRTKATS
jgi:hypothetical protein